MNVMRRCLRRPEPLCGDSGFTLVEAVVAVAVFTVALAVMSSATMSMLTATRQADGVSVATDQVRVGFHRLEKQVRYANAISTPGASGTAWYVEFRTLDWVRDDRTDPDNKHERCVQWRVLNGRLETRSWLINASRQPLDLRPWQTVATGLVNDFATEPPFGPPPPGGRLLLSPLVGGRIYQGLAVQLHVKRSSRPVGRAKLQATFFARNTTAATASAGVCDEVRRA